MAIGIVRRKFIAALGSASIAWPLAARAQQPAMPVIGYLTSRGPDDAPALLAAFRQGLKDKGFVEGQNVAIQYRFGENQNKRLPALVADLVHRQVDVIAALTTQAALAAKAATTTIPIVFETGNDPVQLGLVVSLNRPGGNITGATQTNVEIAPKQLELLHDLIPNATVIALLVNPADRATAETESKAVLSASRALGLELHVFNASSESDFEGVFANVRQLRAGGLVIATEALFTTHSEHLAALAMRHAVPAIYKGREFAAAGGLLSYGSDITESYHLAGIYTGRILKGDKPADLPVQQANKIELFINLKTAKALGITFPLSLLGRADEVIE
jgi:putative tryptophan/tyrosine transport system substrate-binding protein